MKKSHLLLLVFVVLLGYSCSDSVNESDLVGEWEVISFEANTPELSPQLIESAREEAISRRYFFQEDKSFQLNSSTLPKGMNGMYQFSIENSALIMSEDVDEEFPETYQVLILDGNQMKWQQGMGEYGEIFMTLKKVK